MPANFTRAPKVYRIEMPPGLPRQLHASWASPALGCAGIISTVLRSTVLRATQCRVCGTGGRSDVVDAEACWGQKHMLIYYTQIVFQVVSKNSVLAQILALIL